MSCGGSDVDTDAAGDGDGEITYDSPSCNPRKGAWSNFQVPHA